MTDDAGDVSESGLAQAEMGRKAIAGVFWTGIQNWGSQAGSLITFFVLARLLLPEDFGLVALANTFVVFFNLAIDQGLSTALVQREHLEETHWSTAFWVQLCLGVCMTLLGLAGAGLLAEIFGHSMLGPVLQSLSFVFLLRSLILVQRAALKRELAFRSIAVRALLSIFLGGVVGIGMALKGYGVWSLVGQQLTFETIGVVVFWRVSHWRPKWQFSLRHLGDLSRFSVSIFCSNVLGFFNNNFDTLLIGYCLDEVALGYYMIAYRVLQVLTQLLIDTGNQVALPVLAKLQSEPLRLLSAFYKIVGYISLVALPVFAGVVLLAPELIWVVFGAPWMPAVPMMQVLAFGGIFYIILFFNTSVFVAMGQPVLRLRLEFLNVSLNTIGCLIAVRWGVLAVAYAYAISDFLIVPLSLWTLRKLLKVSLRDYARQIFLPIVPTSMTVVLVGILRYWLSITLAPVGVLGICVIAGGTAYILGLRQFAPATFGELRKILSNKDLEKVQS